MFYTMLKPHVVFQLSSRAGNSKAIVIFSDSPGFSCWLLSRRGGFLALSLYLAQ